MLSKAECQKILFQIGLKLGVSPALISTRLLSEEDKTDMVNGLLDSAVLELHVQVWKENGMPDYANGKFDPYKAKDDEPMSRYRGLGKNAE